MADRRLIFQVLRERGLGRNALLATTQSLVTMTSVFLVYRILIAHEGLGGLGLWALLMAFGGMAMAFDISGATALARSLARHKIEFAHTTPAALLHTVLLTSVGINTLVLLVLLAATPTFLPLVVLPTQLQAAWHLLPWIALLILAHPISAGLSAALDGLMRADIRALLVSGAALVGLGTASLLIPSHGILGVAIAQLVQHGTIIAGAWILLRRQVEGLGWFPHNWNFKTFKLTSCYSLKLNLIGILGILFDPMSKYFINLFGGPAALGSYELASRLIIQLRNLVVSASIPLLPAFAVLEKADKMLNVILGKAQRYMALASLAVAGLSIPASIVMSLVILGEISPDVLRMSAIMTFGWSLNILSLPLYLVAQAQGRLRWNIASHLVMALTVAGTALAARQAHPLDMVCGVAAGIVAGAAVTIVGNAGAFQARRMLISQMPATLVVMTFITAGCTLLYLNAAALARITPPWATL